MFFKKYYKKNVPKKYRKLGKKINSSPSLGQLAKRINYVKSLLNVEYKTYDTFRYAAGAITSIGTITTLPQILNIPQGVGESYRVGNSIKVKKLLLRMMINANPSASSPQNVRVLLVRDNNRDTNQAGALITNVTLGNVLKPDDLVTGAVTNICAPLNDATSGRYSVLMNKIFSLDRQARPGVLIDKYLKLNMDVKYPVDGENLPVNGLYLVVMTDAATTQPTITSSVRVTYIDN